MSVVALTTAERGLPIGEAHCLRMQNAASGAFWFHTRLLPRHILLHCVDNGVCQPRAHLHPVPCFAARHGMRNSPYAAGLLLFVLKIDNN
jgi:hypothetical protein